MKRLFSIIVAVAVICSLTMCSSEKKKQEQQKEVAEQTPINVSELQQLAEAGDAIAQSELGVCYHSGNVVAKDVVEAAKWWRMSAEQGFYT